MKYAGICAATLILIACSGPKGAQQADLAFWFKCEERATPALEQQLEMFLRQQGFRVLNLGALRREKGIDFSDLGITALDAKGRIIEISAFPSTPGDQSVGLYSPPPTQHDSVLESALLKFTSEGIGCRNFEVARHDNGPETVAFHNWNVRRIERLFREAEAYCRTAPNNAIHATCEDAGA